MPEPDRPIEPPKIQCHTCSKEIPPDADEHREGDDYTFRTYAERMFFGDSNHNML